MKKNKLRTSLTSPVRELHKEQRNFSNGAGFTLIEGVVILSILIILVLGALLAYQPMRGKARDVQEKATIASLNTAISTYYAKNLSWPEANPFTIMKYPPSYAGESFGNNVYAWGTKKDKAGTDSCNCSVGLGCCYVIYCPHATSDTPSKGLIWYYYYRNPTSEPFTGIGVNLAGEIILKPTSPGN